MAIHHHHHPQPPPTTTTDLFGDPIDTTPPWLTPTTFLTPTFSPTTYISDLRTFIPLPSLRSDLQTHLQSLHHDLVDLINRDYADFVSLSTNLVDVEGAVLRMRAPLLEVRERVVGFREMVGESLGELREGMREEVDGVITLDLTNYNSKIIKWRACATFAPTS